MRSNVKKDKVHTHEGAVACNVGAEEELRRTLMTCLLFENTFYEGGDSVAQRLARCVEQVALTKVAQMTVEAREEMHLRHAPLFMVACLARRDAALAGKTLLSVIQRADELAEFLAIYWKGGRCPVAPALKRALAKAFNKFDTYHLAKYNRDGAVKLRDVMFLVHPKPRDEEQAETFKKLAERTLEPPDTWEVQLSSGADKKETWERLLRENRLGGMAVLRNLRNMQKVGVDETLISERLEKGAARALPFRFITAARHAPTLEPVIEKAMMKSLNGMEALGGKTGLLIDVSGSMEWMLSGRSEVRREDAASGLAILVEAVSDTVAVATFSNGLAPVPSRSGFALRDAIGSSQEHGGTFMGAAVESCFDLPGWSDLDRLIVITDEQSHDVVVLPTLDYPAYLINVTTYKYGVSYGGGWTHIDGWSERVIDYIREVERR